MAAQYPRVGRVRISDEFLLESMVAVGAGGQHVGLLFAAGLIPVQVRDSWERRGYSEYVVISPHFPAVPEGSPIPLYDVTVCTELVDEEAGEYRVSEFQISGALEPYQAICTIKIGTLETEVSVYHNETLLSKPLDPQALADTLGAPVTAEDGTVYNPGGRDSPAAPGAVEDTGAADDPS